MNHIATSIVSWSEKQSELTSIRRTVFIQEQNVPEDIELDGKDSECYHVLATDEDGKPIGTARMDKEGKIGRMAVLREYRGRGVGRDILRAIMDFGRFRGMTDFHLSAQVEAVGFYEKMGFEAWGEEFEEAGMKHVNMRFRMP